MAVYKVTASRQQYHYVEVEATDEDSARNKALDMDIEQWSSDDDGDFEITEVILGDCQYTDQQELKDRESEHNEF